MTIDLPIHYRINDYPYHDGIFVVVELWHAIKKTPRGYWVKADYAPSWIDDDAYLRKHGYLRWVNNTSAKRWCYPQLAKAIESFVRRRQIYAEKLRYRLDQVDTVLKNTNKFETATVEQLMKGISIGDHPMHELFLL